MRPLQVFSLAIALCLAGSAVRADVKYYDSSAENGEPIDLRRFTATICPPLRVTPDGLQGYTRITDDGTGTVTLDEHVQVRNSVTDIGSDILASLLGPGAFIFVIAKSTTSVANPAVSNTTGIGSHGPSGTAPGQTAEWGVVTGFQVTGFNFCLSSPTTQCENNVGPHGMTVPEVLASDTYDLGTWNFDAEGDLEAANWYINRTSSGGLSNNQTLVQGAFHGASLPALPLVGFGALALALAMMGGRALVGRR